MNQDFCQEQFLFPSFSFGFGNTDSVLPASGLVFPVISENCWGMNFGLFSCCPKGGLEAFLSFL